MSYHTRSRNRTRQRTQRTNQTRDNQQRGQTSTPNRSAGSASSLPIVEAPVQIVDNTARTASTSTRSTTPIGDRKKLVGKKKKKKRSVRNIFETPQQPIPPAPPEPELIAVNKTLYDGANVRLFYGIENTPIDEFISTVLKDVPLFKIDEIDGQGNVLNTYQLHDKKMGGKKRKKKKKKFSIVKGDTKDSYKTKTPEQRQSLTQITDENRYNISVDGVPGQAYPITFMGLQNPNEISDRYYDEPPIELIPASLPNAYQNSANDGVELLKDGRRCGNCIFYDSEVGNCSKWNALVRLNYWCAAWQTMAPIIAEPNQFTQNIEQDGEIYDYFLENVKDPTTQEPNLNNFLSPLNPLFTTYGAYVYGDYLRRVVDSGDAFDFDGAPINLLFTTQEGFLNAIDFINNSNLNQFEDPPEEYDSIQQALCTYTLTKKSTSTLPSNYPQVITINLHGKFYGEPINILSQLDLMNAKIAYNPQFTVDSHRILKDNRFDTLEENGVLHIDIIKPSIRERVLKFLLDNSREYRLDGSSSYSFIQWVADRSAFTESLQALYQLLLTVPSISSENQELLDAIELSLGEQLLDDPSNTLVPLTTQVVDAEVNE